MIELPDSEEPITLTGKDYPELGECTVTFHNPRKIKKNLERYYEKMVELYFKWAFKEDEFNE